MSDDNLNALLAEYADDDGKLSLGGDLSIITALANRQLELEQELQIAELRVQVLKEQRRQVAEERLPEAMQAAGVKDFTLSDGSKVTIRDDVQTSFRAEQREAALQWLQDNGHGSIIKHVIACEFGKGDNEAAEAALNLLDSAGFSPIDKEDVHYQTLQAWGRNQAKEGMRPPEEFFNVFDLHIAKIKAPKK